MRTLLVHRQNHRKNVLSRNQSPARTSLQKHDLRAPEHYREDGQVSTTAFGDFLRFYRSRVPLTQEELAERTGLSMRAISDMERGRTLTPQFRTVQLLVGGLGLEGDEAAEFTALAR